MTILSVLNLFFMFNSSSFNLYTWLWWWHLGSNRIRVVNSLCSLSNFIFQFWQKTITSSNSCACSLSSLFKVRSCCLSNLSCHIRRLSILYIQIRDTSYSFLKLSHIKGFTRRYAFNAFVLLEISSKTSHLLKL